MELTGALFILIFSRSVLGSSPPLLQSKIKHVMEMATQDLLKSYSNHYHNPITNIEFLPVDASFEAMMFGNETQDFHLRNRRSIPASTPPSRVQVNTPNGYLNVPEINVSEQDFAHEYIPQTGVGNREEIKLVSIQDRPIRLTVASPPLYWKSIRFNSSDFFMSVHRNHINVWKMIRPLEQPFDQRYALCSLLEGDVISSDFHSRMVHHYEVLRISLVVLTPHSGFQLKTFDVSESGCVPLTVFQLRSRPKKLIVVSSAYESSVVVLTEGISREATIEFKQILRDSNSRVIEVSIAQAMHLSSFTISGHPYLAIGHGSGVEVGRLNELMNHYMPFDAIPIRDVTDIQTFQMGFSLYMGVTTSGLSQHLFEWRSGSFRLKQTMSASRVTGMKLLPLPSCRDDTLLILMTFDRRHPILIYSWSALREEFVLAVDDVRKFGVFLNSDLISHSVTAFTSNHSGVLMAMDTQGFSHALTFQTVLIPITDPVYVETLRTTDMMKNLRDRLLQQEQFVQRLLLLVNSAIKTNELPILKHPHVIRNLAAMKPSVVRKFKELRRLSLQGSPMTLQDLLIRTQDLNQVAHHLLKSLKELDSVMKHIAFRNQPTIMSGANVLEAGDAFILNSTHTRITLVNDVNVQQLFSGIFEMNGKVRPILARKFFQDLTVIGGVRGLINGVDLANAVMTNTPNLVTSHLLMNNVRVDGNLFARDINGIDLTRDVIGLDRGIYFIPRPVVFSAPVLLIFGLVTPKLGSVDVNFLKHNVMLTNAAQEVSSPVFFASRTSISGDVRTTKVNGWDIIRVASDIVRVDKECVILSPKQFMTAEFLVRQSLFVNGTLNGISVPRDIFLTNVLQDVPSLKRFVGHHTFEGDVVVNGLLDGVLLQNAASLSQLEELPPLVFTKGIDVFRSITGARSVDGVDLRQLDHFGMKGGQAGGTLNNPVFSGPVLVRRHVQMAGPVNNLKINALAADTIFRNMPAEVRGCKTFLAGLFAPKGLRIRSINGMSLDSFSRTSAPESISHLVFSQPTFRNLMVKDAMINGINLLNLHLQRISLREPGYIAGGKRFLHELRANSIVVNGTIHDVVPRRDLTSKTSHGQVVTAEKIMKHTDFKGVVKVLKTVRGKLLDGVNVTRLSYQRVTLDSAQVMRMPALLVDSTTDLLFAPVFNNLDLAKFLPNVLLVNGMRQVVAGTKTFLKPVFVANEVESVQGVNGIHLQEVDEKAVKLHGITVVTAEHTFLSLLRVKEVSGNGLVNNINFNLFAADVLFKRNTEAILTASNIFTQGFRVNANVDALSINKLHLPSSIFLRVGHQTIHGYIRFAGNAVFAKRDVRVGKSVGGIRLSDFQQRIMRTNFPSTVNADLFFQEPVYVRGSVRVGGRVSGVKLNHLHKNTLYKVYDQFIPGDKVLNAPIIVNSDLNLLTLNNMSFDETIRDMIFIKSRIPAEFLRHNTFSNIVIFYRNVHSMTSQTFLNGRITGIDLDTLVSKIVLTDRVNVVSGVKTFGDTVIAASNFLVKGRINGIHLLNDTFFLIHPQGLTQFIPTSKTFGRIKSDYNLEVDGQVNGLDLKAEAEDTLYLTGDQRITGRKNFHALLTMNNVHTAFTEPNLNQVAVLRGDNFFVGSLSFLRPISIEGNTHVHGTLNNRIPLTDLFTYSLNKNSPQVIGGPLSFDEAVFFGNVSTRGRINGVILNVFARDVTGFRQRVYLQEKSIEGKMIGQVKKSSYNFDLLLDNPYIIDSFILRQELPGIHGNHYEVQGDGMFSMSQLDPQEVNSTTYQMRYKRDDNGFESKRVEVNVPFVKKVNFKLQNSTFSVVRFPSSEQVITQIKMGQRVIATLDQYVDSMSVITKNKNTAYIALFVGIRGHIKIYALVYSDRRVNLSPISILNVGASATKMTLFSIDSTLYLAVARSFRGQCSVSDYGSLLFQLQGNSFKLVQRIPVSDSHHVVYYENNGQHYLAFSELGDASAEASTQSIHVFKKKEISGCQFVLFQTLPFDNLQDLNVVSYGTTSRQQLLLTGVNATAMSVWRQDGHSGFKDSWVMRVDGGESVQPVFVRNHGLFFIVSQGQRCRGSLVFEAKCVGSSLLAIKMKNNWTQ